MPSPAIRDGLSTGPLIKLICALGLAGLAMRMTLLAIPPVIPLVHAELRMSETQVGLLVGLPLAVFAIAAVPGSLLIARIGTNLAVILGMAIAAIAGGARGAAVDTWTLYAAAIASGFGIAIMQPGLPTLVRAWLPNRIALGTIAYSSGMVIGATLPPALTIPFILPMIGNSWRLDLALWAVPAVLIVLAFFLLSPPAKDRRDHGADTTKHDRWWPDWKNPLIWLLGLTFGCNASPFFATNAFLGDYLASRGQADLLGLALSWLNGAQLLALVVVLVMANRLQRRAWPFLLFGPAMLAAFFGLIFLLSPFGLVVSSALIGISTAITMTAILALPAFLSAPGDVPRIAAGMFTVAYSCAIIIPTMCGALWDLTGKPWTAFVPLCICAVGLTMLGTVAARFRPAHEMVLIRQ